MSLFFSFVIFFVGLFVGYVIPRLPLIFFSRLQSLNYAFSKHPEPVKVTPELLARIITMRKLYWSGLIYSIIPVLFGWLIIRWSGSSLGFGLLLSGGWTILARILPAGENEIQRYPYSMNLVHSLHDVRVRCKLNELPPTNQEELLKDPCCGLPNPVWEIAAVRCTNCRSILLNEPRPDLGRVRSDGIIRGSMRVMILDGRPPIHSSPRISSKTFSSLSSDE